MTRVFAYLNMIKAGFTHFNELNPCFLLATGLFQGILFFLLPCSYFIYLSIVLLSLLLLSLSLKLFMKFIFSFIIGILVFLFFDSTPDDSYLRLIPKHGDCGALISAVVNDASATGDDIPWLSNPKYIVADICSLKFSSSDDERFASGKLLLVLPCEAPIFGYGDELSLEGAFEEPDSRKYGKLLSFKDHLRAKGIHRIFKIRKLEVIKKMSDNPIFTEIGKYSFFKLLKLRNFLLKNIANGMRDEDKRIFASLFFGCRQGLSYEQKQKFRKSGVMHIFAISGLHVGMLALNLLLIFFFLPFRIRYIVVTALLFLYVLSTGLQPSALRAFIMISIWAFHRVFLRSISPLNTVFVAFAFSLSFNPMNIFSVGFHYSFIITIFLIVSWQSGKKWIQIFNTNIMFIPSPSGKYLFFHSLKNKFLNTVFTSIVCCLASSGINVLHGNLFIPGAFFANLVILPFVWLLFLVASVNFFFSFFSHCFSIVQEGVLEVIIFLSSVAADWSGAFFPPRIYWCLIIIYFVALFFLLNSKSVKAFLLSFSTIFFLLFLFSNYSIFRATENYAVIIYGGTNGAETLICLPKYKKDNVVMNVGSYEKAKAIISIFRQKGINQIDYLIFSGTDKNSCKGASLLFSALRIDKILIPYSARDGYDYKKTIMLAEKNRIPVFVIKKTHLPGGFNFKSYNLNFSIQNGSHSINLQVPELHLGIRSEKKPGFPRIINISLNGEKVVLKLKNSLHMYKRELCSSVGRSENAIP